MDYVPQGVCAKLIQYDVDGENTIHNVKFTGGCAGNQTAICRLVEGMKVDDAISMLEGIPCGKRPTSCPDQLAQALKAVKQN